jgi:hypothetical protein
MSEKRRRAPLHFKAKIALTVIGLPAVAACFYFDRLKESHAPFIAVMAVMSAAAVLYWFAPR